MNHNSPEAQASEAARLADPVNHVQYPAGWVSPERAEAAERQAIAEELSREQAEAERGCQGAGDH